MKRLILILGVLFLINTVKAQKVVYNPDFKGVNFAGRITKVEILDSVTILHFIFKESLGSKFSIPPETYIEDSERGNRLYVNGSEGINRISGWNIITEAHLDGFRYKLFFPTLNKDTKKINYGESNLGGNWYMYKVDLTKNGMGFIAKQNFFRRSNLQTGLNTIPKNNKQQVSIAYAVNKDGLLNGNSDNNSHLNTTLPKDLSKVFFGNWYDKYGTLLLVTTQDYVILDNRIQYYRNIEKKGEKYKISISSNTFEVLNFDAETITIRTNRILTLKRGPETKSVPNYLQGEWLHWKKIKEIRVTDDYFYNNDNGELGVNELVSRVDKVIESDAMVWFVLYHEGAYSLYTASKKEGAYILHATGFENANYEKI